MGRVGILSTVIAPPRVADIQAYWTDPPPEPSARCTWWRERISAGWRPNKRVSAMGYHEAAEYFGVWIWEYVEVLSPMLQSAQRNAMLDEARAIAEPSIVASGFALPK